MKRLGLIASLALACATTQAPQQPPAQASAPRAKHLTIVGINDTHGGLLEQARPKWLSSFTDLPIGGADWFAGYLNAIRAEARERDAAVVVLDGGDMFQGTLISNQFRGRSVVEVYNTIGVTAAAVGNHEFDFSVPVLADRIREARFPILSANIFKKGTRERPEWAHPTAMIDLDGVKIGIIGLSTIETATVTNPLFVQDLEFVAGGPVAAGLADELRKQGATVVIVTAHAGPLGADGKRSPVPSDEEAQQIANACAGKIDAIVSGHNHTSIGCCKPGQARCACGTGQLTVAGIPIIQSGAKLTQLSVIDLDLDQSGHATGFRVNEGTLPYAGGPQPLLHDFEGKPATWHGRPVSPDPTISAILARYDGEVKALRETRIGSTEVPLVKGGPNDLLANFTADALRSGAGGGLPARFAFQNQGGLRITEIPRGPITFGQIFDLTPFDNQQVVVTLTGPQIREALEEIIKAGKSPLRVSGLHYVIDLSGHDRAAAMASEPVGKLVPEIVDDSTGQPICKTSSCTATSCDATCAPGDYTVAVTDFLANGGDGLAVLKSAPRQVGPALARDVIVAWVKTHDPITPQLLGSTATGGQLRIAQRGPATPEHD